MTLRSEVRIGEDIQITVLGMKGNLVRIGFAAPKDLEVHREAFYDRIKPEQATGGKRS